MSYLMHARQRLTLLSTVTKVVMDLPNKFGYERLWSVMVGVQSVQFRAKACQDVYVALGRVPGSASFYTYEIILGGDSNTLSQIKRNHDGPTVASYPGTILRRYICGIK